MATKIIKEHFTSINQMLTVINSRPNNDIMRYEHASRSEDKSFTGTNNWEEAIDLFEHGYTEILPEIKAGVAAGIKKTETIQKRRTSTGVVGYAAHVPNAIMGLPNSMIYTQATPQKIKAVSIAYYIGANCTTDAQEFIDSGIAILNVINRLELNGCRVNLRIVFDCAVKNGEYSFASVDVKHYREHLDLQKLCFPVAHPSMFRRFGFKWIETCIGMTENWSIGYGSSIKSNDEKHMKVVKECLYDNEFYMDLTYTRKYNYDADKIIESMNIK